MDMDMLPSASAQRPAAGAGVGGPGYHRRAFKRLAFVVRVLARVQVFLDLLPRWQAMYRFVEMAEGVVVGEQRVLHLVGEFFHFGRTALDTFDLFVDPYLVGLK